MNFYLQSFLIFLKIGLFTIGGGYAMVPLIQDEIVDKRKWIDKEDFIDLLALTQSVPGIFAVNIAIFIGYKLRKFRGALAMALGTILPSFFIILAIALFFQQFKQYPIVENIFKGIRPAVVALIAAPTFSMAKSAKINRYLEVALRQMAGRIFLGKVMNKQEVWTKPDLRFECLKLLLIPIVPDVLYVVVVLQQINELLHVLDVVLIFQLDIVLRHHLHGGLDEGIALLLQGGQHGAEGIGVGVDLKGLLLHLHIVRARIQRVHHHGVLVQILFLDDDDALAVKGPGHAARSPQALAVLVQQVAHLGSGAVAVVGQRVHDYGHAGGSIALVHHVLVAVGIAGAKRLVNGTLDIVVGHVGGLGLGNDGGQAGVVVGVAAAAGLDRHDHLTGDLGKYLRTLGVRRALGLLNIVPLGMS